MLNVCLPSVKVARNSCFKTIFVPSFCFSYIDSSMVTPSTDTPINEEEWIFEVNESFSLSSFFHLPFLPSIISGIKTVRLYPQRLHSSSLSSSYTCPVAGVSVCATNTALQREQCLPSVKPVVVQVAGIAWSMTSICPRAGVSVCSTNTVLQRKQCLPSVKPVAVQVAATALSMTSICPKAVVSVCSTNVVLHREQCLPSVKPVVVQVAATASSMTSICPKEGVSVCSTNVVLQREQCLPAVKPVFVQVAAIALSMTSL